MHASFNLSMERDCRKQRQYFLQLFRKSLNKNKNVVFFIIEWVFGNEHPQQAVSRRMLQHTDDRAKSADR